MNERYVLGAPPEEQWEQLARLIAGFQQYERRMCRALAMVICELDGIRMGGRNLEISADALEIVRELRAAAKEEIPTG